MPLQERLHVMKATKVDARDARYNTLLNCRSGDIDGYERLRLRTSHT